MDTVTNRRQRRAAMKFNKFFKIKNSLTFKKRNNFRKESIKRGNEIFSKNLKIVEDSINKQLESSEKTQVDNWERQNYNKTEIDMLKEANAIISVRHLESWHEEKKKARKLIKGALKSKIKRLVDG